MTDKRKLGEIQRLQRFIDESGLQLADIAEKTGVSERTIKNQIYENQPISGKFLKELHLKTGVSVDWILSGVGHMWANYPSAHEDPAEYNPPNNPRAERIAAFLRDWYSYASTDEQAWLEQELKFRLPQFSEFLRSN